MLYVGEDLRFSPQFDRSPTVRCFLYACYGNPLYNLVSYQRRAKNAGQCGVEVEGGRLPAQDWMLNLQILTSGGFR
jgi:hypothetical protein